MIPTPSFVRLVIAVLLVGCSLGVAVSACSGGSAGKSSEEMSSNPPVVVPTGMDAGSSPPSAEAGSGDGSSVEAAPGDAEGDSRSDSQADAQPDAQPDAQTDGGPLDATLGDVAADAVVVETDSSDASALKTVTFQYTPGWSGVTAVAVVGAFGLPTDWKPLEPFVALVADGHGGFTGSAELADGTYPYLFLVTGDEAAATPSTYARYVIDPSNPDYAACPPGSPTFTDAAPQPCSQLAVPQAAPAPLYHVQGTVTENGSPEGNYLVVIERDETGSHHFMANRTSSQPKPSDGGVADAEAADGGGAGSFDLLVAAGHYRLQVLHPTYLSKTDAERNPTALQAILRAVSSAVRVQADTVFPNVDVAYTAAEYDKLAPRGDGDGGATLPTQFTFSLVTGSRSVQVAVYGPGDSVGDPWWENAEEHDGGTATFDGGFDLSTGAGMSVAPGTRYWWGVWQYPAASDAGVTWSEQSMVFPITWN
jgi:hypothetical protein